MRATWLSTTALVLTLFFGGCVFLGPVQPAYSTCSIFSSLELADQTCVCWLMSKEFMHVVMLLVAVVYVLPICAVHDQRFLHFFSLPVRISFPGSRLCTLMREENEVSLST